MKLNPFLNAVLAALYITLVVVIIDTFSSNKVVEGIPLVPITMLSLFVLSAAVMGFLFVYEPLRLFLENKKEEGFFFFIKTTGTFACLVALFAAALLYTSFL